MSGWLFAPVAAFTPGNRKHIIVMHEPANMDEATPIRQPADASDPTPDELRRIARILKRAAGQLERRADERAMHHARSHLARMLAPAVAWCSEVCDRHHATKQ